MSTNDTNNQEPVPPQTNTAATGDVEFMSMMSHQLATPIGTVRWYAELLRMGKMTKPLDTEQTAMVDEILLGINRLNDLVNGIHNISRLEQGKFADEPASVVLADLVTAAQSQHQADITAKNLTFSVVGQPGLSIVARPSIVSLILENLISNAVKYTPDSGTITVTLRPATNEEVTQAKIESQNCVLISVADTGYGIPKNQHAQVFSKFFRGDNVAGKSIEGSGLGLAGVATAVTKLAGGIWFESEEGQGTTMFVVLPTA